MDGLGQYLHLLADETKAVLVEVQGLHLAFLILILSEKEHKDGNDSVSDNILMT